MMNNGNCDIGKLPGIVCAVCGCTAESVILEGE
jgi:hypothetical protein